MKEHLVSVLTPVYNGEAYISRLLDSILRQTYSDIEMILVDDGSDDSTVEIVNSYIPKFEFKGYSLTVISCIHRNASAAINAGLPYVNGQYLVWPDSDDELLPDSIEVRVRFLESHQDYHCVRSIMEYISDETGAPTERTESLGDLNNEELFWDVLEYRSFVCCGCYMLETEPFFQIYPDKKITESDFGQNFQMLLPFLFKYRCPTIKRKLYRVYVRLNSHSHQKKVDQITFERLIDEIVRICSIKNKADLLRVDMKKMRCREQRAYIHHQYIKAIKYKIIVQWLRIKRFFVQTLDRSGL